MGRSDNREYVGKLEFTVDKLTVVYFLVKIDSLLVQLKETTIRSFKITILGCTAS